MIYDLLEGTTSWHEPLYSPRLYTSKPPVGSLSPIHAPSGSHGAHFLYEEVNVTPHYGKNSRNS